MSGRKKSRAFLSLQALRQAARLTPSLVLHDVPPAPMIVKALASIVVVVVTPTSPSPSIVSAQEVTHTAGVNAQTFW